MTTVSSKVSPQQSQRSTQETTIPIRESSPAAAVMTTTTTPFASSSDTTTTAASVGNASQGSFGLQQQQQYQQHQTNKKSTTTTSTKPAIELVHRNSSTGSSNAVSLRRTAGTTGTTATSIIPPVAKKPAMRLPAVSKNGRTATTTTISTAVAKSNRGIRSDTNSVATPSSVHLIRANSSASSRAQQQPYALSRDLSDLSGSYYNGASGRSSGGGGVAAGTATIMVSSSTDPKETRIWRQAKVLSSQRLPQHPQPHYIDDESSYGANHTYRNSMMKQKSLSMSSSNNSNSKATSISFDRGGDIIEVSLPIHPSLSSHHNNNTETATERKGNRIPLILVLMDPARKLYELLQLWIDTSIDTVRDILQTINKNLDNSSNSSHRNNHWKQDYDGLFQIRNNHFSQLIHVLPAGKYDIVPGEVWICKPWSMTSKQTVSYAGTCLNHLKSRHILQYRKCSDYGPIWKQWKVFRSSSSNSNSNSATNSIKNSTNKFDDTVLVLSKKATQRLYVPGGILKHHHACQFLAFVPPMEQCNGNDYDDNDKMTTPATATLRNDCSQSTASGLSDSHCDDDDDDNSEDVAHHDDEDETMGMVEDTSHDNDDGKHYIDTNIANSAARESYNRDNINALPKNHHDHRHSVDDSSNPTDTGGTFSVTDDDDVGTESPLIVARQESGLDSVGGFGGGATVCSTKTKESTYNIRTYTRSSIDSPTKSSSLWNNSSNKNRPIPHVLPGNGCGTANDRPAELSSSSSSFHKTMRRFYTLFQCRQQHMSNRRRSPSYDEQSYYNHNNNNVYSTAKQRKSCGGTTTRTTLLSDDASMITTNHPFNRSSSNDSHCNKSESSDYQQQQQQQWREIDTASHCSGVPLLLTSAPTADWVTHI